MASLTDYLIDLVKQSNIASDSQVNALATATAAAVASCHNIACKVDASYSTSTVSGLLTFKFGTTTKGTKYIHGAGAIDFGTFGVQNPTVNQSVSAELAAGGVGVTGTVVLTFYTTGPSA